MWWMSNNCFDLLHCSAWRTCGDCSVGRGDLHLFQLSNEWSLRCSRTRLEHGEDIWASAVTQCTPSEINSSKAIAEPHPVSLFIVYHRSSSADQFIEISCIEYWQFYRGFKVSQREPHHYQWLLFVGHLFYHERNVRQKDQHVLSGN